MSPPTDSSEETPLLCAMSKSPVRVARPVASDDDFRDDSSGEVVVQDYDDSRKIGITGAVFLILNKMIGTGSE